MLLFFNNKSFLYIPFFLGNPPIKTTKSQSLNIYDGLSPYSTDLQRGNAQSLIYMTTAFRTFIVGAMSRSFRIIFLFPNAFPFSNWGMNEYPICPAAPVTQTVIASFMYKYLINFTSMI